MIETQMPNLDLIRSFPADCGRRCRRGPHSYCVAGLVERALDLIDRRKVRASAHHAVAPMACVEGRIRAQPSDAESARYWNQNELVRICRRRWKIVQRQRLECYWRVLHVRKPVRRKRLAHDCLKRRVFLKKAEIDRHQADRRGTCTCRPLPSGAKRLCCARRRYKRRQGWRSAGWPLRRCGRRSNDGRNDLRHRRYWKCE